MKINPMMPLMMGGLIMVISLLFIGQGVNMQGQVHAAEEEFHALQDEYFTLAKSVRDGAETGSDLNAKLVELQQTPSTLLELKLVGVGKMLTGIYVLLFGILTALIVMPFRMKDILTELQDRGKR